MQHEDSEAVEFILNASNLHVGGAVQVATSVITEISAMDSIPNPLRIIASTEIVRELNRSGANLQPRLFTLTEKNTFGLTSLLENVFLFGGNRRVVFTLFGPLYGPIRNRRNIVGFAQPWIIYPDNECYARLPRLKRISTRLKYWVQGKFFRRADLLIVELEHVKQGLIRVLGIPAERVHVVHNCISAIYLDKTLWQPVDVPHIDDCLKLGCLGRNYSHKNTTIFPEIVRQLWQEYGIRARVYVTFTHQEWAACTPDFREACVNVGPLSVTQCPLFYQALDAVVFPSLLECFSVTPLEAMVMEKPLFASDRPFNRDICGPHAHYFDPLVPATAANAIARTFEGDGPSASCLRAARDHAIGFSNPAERARKYLSILWGCSGHSDEGVAR